MVLPGGRGKRRRGVGRRRRRRRRIEEEEGLDGSVEPRVDGEDDASVGTFEDKVPSRHQHLPRC
jgi:hypothetical protein